MATVDVTVNDVTGGWTADVRVVDRTTTTHRVRITSAEHARFGGGDVRDLVSRSFDFLLARESNTSILREFSLSTIEQYFPDYRDAMTR